MLGAIRKRDILAHPIVTIRCFGWRLFWKVIWAGPNQTFLALVAETQVASRTTIDVPKLLERCVELERSAQRIYEQLAEKFANIEELSGFLRTLAHQEQGHAELLEVCRAALLKGRFRQERFEPWREAVPRLAHELKQREARLDTISTAREALEQVLEIEASEINRVFLGAVGATDSEFVQRLDVFWSTGQKHLRFAGERIAELEPSLASQCQDLRQSSRAGTEAEESQP
jgi:rubrerythrin